MKTLTLLSFILIISLNVISEKVLSQIGFSPVVDSIINLATNQTMSRLNRELSGDTSCIIGGTSYTILSRHWNTAHNPKAAQYIYEKFQSFGLNTRYQNISATNINVIGWKTGTKYPDKQYIICAHYDDMPSGSLAPGADDNASGTCTVIEAARLLSSYTFDYTVIFIAFDEEERGLLGSMGYADTAFLRGDSIMGVINLDMIAYDGNNDYRNNIHTNTNSLTFADEVINAFNIYQPVLVPAKIFSLSGGSDHQSFWNKGYKAILSIESITDFNPYYHTVQDNFSHVNVPFFTSMTRGSIAALLSFAWDYKIKFTHTPIQSGSDTTSRTAEVVITSPHRLAGSSNAPKLYYKVNNGSFVSIGAFYNNLDTFKFLIPGKPVGTTISYYFAAQDTLGRFTATLPSGGRGLNPPGTVAPSSFFVYEIAAFYNMTKCSNTLPKPITDLSNTYDSIPISSHGKVTDINVNMTIYHTWLSDLDIYLKGPDNTEIDLCSDNGGSGDNFINTTFDDEASLSITEGSPPYTGSFRPEEPLSAFDNSDMYGNWILRVYDDASGDVGQLISWCVILQYSDIQGITGNEVPFSFSLSQNFPNPFNSQTTINFTLPKTTDVKLYIYDILGRIVKQLVDDKLTKGDYGVHFNAGEFSSGVYFYSIWFDGIKFTTRKMILVK